MRRAQVSIEFMVLFGFMLVVFLVFGNYMAERIANEQSAEGMAEQLARNIKSGTITASMASSSLNYTIFIPERIEGIRIGLELYAHPDNILIIRDNVTGVVFAREFLPAVDSIDETGGSGVIKNVTIVREAGGSLSIIVAR